MTILQEIQTWSATLPAWQRDAIARLFEKGTLDQSDEADIYALLKVEHGIPDPDGRVAKPLDASRIAAPVADGKLIQFVAIRDLKHVNALAEGQKIPFSPSGLTVVYGDNGSGKSGYSRVLKKACRARDQSEQIYPDARLAAKAGPAEAIFDILVDGNAKELKWVADAAAPEELSSMSIFDAYCARAYLDDEGDFSYSPYGFDILGGLAKLCGRMKQLAEAEYTAAAPVSAGFSHLANFETDVGKAITTLSDKTKPERIETLATLSEEEVQRYSALDKAIKEGNPKEKAALLRQRISRFEALASRMEEKGAIVSDVAKDSLRGAILASKTAKDAALMAAKVFKETPGLLAGTGEEKWQELFDAARAYAAESHPQVTFPNFSPDDKCPLCQEPLEGGAARLVSFDNFINNAVEKNARDKRDTAIAAFNAITKADLSIGLDKHLKDELVAADKDIGEACESFGKLLHLRATSIRTASSPDGDWNSVGSLPDNPAVKVRAIASTLQAEAEALEKIIDEDARENMLLEFKGLDARVKLAPLKDAVLTAIDAHILQAKLLKCSGATKTTAISNKATELSEKVISKDLETALNNEFRRLNVGHLHVCLKPFSSKGKTYYKLALELPSQQKPITNILSEGEQRAIALASFFAETNLSGGKGGIAFDDPVSSLDHKRRGYVAKRLAEEAQKRQVTVFTHDLYFLCLLQQEATDAGVEMVPHSLNRTELGYGVCADEFPFDGAACKARVGILRNMQLEVAHVSKAGNEAEAARLTREAYASLRQTWERGVEEVLFSEAVLRFSVGVSTQRLRNVEVADDDYRDITAGMTKCSKFSGHDGAAQANVSTPPPDELLQDIESFEAWRKAAIKRKEDVENRRKK